MFIELKWQRLGAVENLQILTQQLDLAGLQVSVRGARRAHPHQACDFQYELIAHALGHGEHRGLVRIEHDLQQPLAIAQIDEDDAAMVTAAMRPTGDRDDLPGQ
jgi:hypothetical protein